MYSLVYTTCIRIIYIYEGHPIKGVCGVYQSYSLQGDAAMGRDLLDKHGEVVIDEKHKLDVYLARSGSSSADYVSTLSAS